MSFTRKGYGQVEPNQLSGQKTGQIYARLPIAEGVEVLQNGEFMYYDYASGTVTAENGHGEPMLVFNEVKLYGDKRNESYKDFAMIPTSFDPSEEVFSSPYTLKGTVPRMLKTNVGDIYTTNMISAAAAEGGKEGEMQDIAEGTQLKLKKIGKTLVLATDGDIDGMTWIVCKGCGTDHWTMPDGQPAVKIQRIQ